MIKKESEKDVRERITKEEWQVHNSLNVLQTHGHMNENWHGEQETLRSNFWRIPVIAFLDFWNGGSSNQIVSRESNIRD